MSKTPALGHRVRLARERRGLNQQQLVALLRNVTQQNISALESRNSKTSEHLFAIADALHVNPRWLLTGEGESWLDQEKKGAPDMLATQLLELVNGLSLSSRKHLLEYAAFLCAKRPQNASIASDYTKTASAPPKTLHQPPSRPYTKSPG